MADINTNTQTSDVVAVLDKDFNQLFPDGRPIKASVTETAKLMEHPIETGAVITDHRIINPVEIELSLILTGDAYPDVYKAIKDVFTGNSTVVVQTRTDSYQNMLIQAMPHEETPDMVDVIAMALKLRQVLLIDVQFQALPPRRVVNRKDASVLDMGEKTANNSSVAYRLFNFGGGTPPKAN